MTGTSAAQPAAGDQENSGWLAFVDRSATAQPAPVAAATDARRQLIQPP